MDDRSMLRIASVLEPRGIRVVRFNFPYRERGSRRIDPMPVLMESIAGLAKQSGPRVLIGGRSMGGRVATMLAAEGFPCAGLILLAYPLHPAGQPDKLRVAHWPRVKAPVLCISGTRDPLCAPELMKQALSDVHWTMHWLEAADHSFKVLKSSGRTEADVDAEVGDVCERWLP
jgi:uncharacterized protein